MTHPAPLSRFDKAVYRFALLASRFLLFFFGGSLRVTGWHNIPPSGPYIAIVNHMSVADSLLLLLALPGQRLHFLIGEKWENVPVIGWIAPRLGGIFVDRHTLDRQALRRAEEVLAAGGIMGLAPEAGRSPIGQMIRPRHGAAWLADRCEVPVLPIGIVNSDKLFRNFLRLRRTLIAVHIGTLFPLPPATGRVRRQERLTALSDYMMLRIARLLPARYHGYYHVTSHPGLPLALRDEDPWPACRERAGRS